MTIDQAQEKIIIEFKSFDNQMDKYNYLIKLGQKLPSMNEKDKNEKNVIKDCQVKTWFQSGTKCERIFYYIDSKSLITRGVVSLLIRVLSGQKPEDICKTELYFIEQIGLKEIFSLYRANSLGKLVERIYLEAKKYAK